jgi:hypothetical protein
MAKSKKSRGSDVPTQAPSSGGCKAHISIDSADNGMIVRIDGDHEGKFFEKKFVATSPRQAFRIAAAHMPTMAKKSAGKKSKGKKFATGKKV